MTRGGTDCRLRLHRPAMMIRRTLLAEHAQMEEVEEREAVGSRRVPIHHADEALVLDQEIAPEEVAMPEAARQSAEPPLGVPAGACLHSNARRLH